MKSFIGLTIGRFKSAPRLRRTLYLLCVALIGLYGFSIFAFASRPLWNYVNLAIGGAMVVMILVYELIYEDIRLDEYCLLLFGFCWCVLFASLMNGVGGSISKSLFTQAAFGVALYQFAKNPNHLRDALVSFFVGGTAFALYFVVHYWNDLTHFSITDFSSRLGSFFDNENNIARAFVFLGLLSFYFVLCKKQWWLVVHTVGMAFLTLSTGSISNLLCFVIGIIAILFFTFKGRQRWIVLAALVVLAVIIIAILRLPSLSYLSSRLENMIYSLFGFGGGDRSANERFELAKDAFLFFLDSPIFGHGYNYVAEHSVGFFAHNNFLEILADYGLFALVFFETMLIIPFLRLRKHRGSIKVFIGSTLIYLFVFQLFLVTYYTKIDHIIISFAFAATSRSRIASVFVNFRKRKLNMGFEWNISDVRKKDFFEKKSMNPRVIDIDHFSI